MPSRLVSPCLAARADSVTPEEPVALDPNALLLHTLDVVAYGNALAAQLFPEGGQLRSVWERARTLADGAGLPLRLPTAADDLHALR
ncbi:MAG: hypothetical protein HGA19_04965 [Oscillochloris sp.]|nr:hypothetical protein [Oscillochloris sp.]